MPIGVPIAAAASSSWASTRFLITGFIGQIPNTDFLTGSDVRTDRWGFIVTGHDLTHDGEPLPGLDGRAPHFLETSIPGIFAAGDVRTGSTKQVASAAGEGATAALLIRE